LLAESGETPGYTPPALAPPAPPPAAPEETKKRKLEASEDHRQPKKTSAVKGKEWTGKPNEMDRLAQGLQKLQEDDLLQVVRIVTDHKTPEMYVKNDLEGMKTFLIQLFTFIEGEFILDLYTLGDPLLRILWDFIKQRVEV
jgi:transcription initiation factor TFIID/TFIIF subunit